MRLEELRDSSAEELHALYDDGEIPDDVPEADMRGVVLAGRGPARTSAWNRIANLAPWSGMRIGDAGETGDGVNYVGYGPLVFERYGFETYVEQDREGGALVLDYDVPANPYALRRLKEYVRKVDGVYLGRAYVEIGGRRVFLHYYAMEPEETEIPVRR